LDRIGAVLVDTYRIERLIAEGGMGAVYEASHLRIPKKFAIKFLKVSLLDNSVALLRFRREAEVVATLDHPNIISLFDYNITEDGVPYTVLEYMEGEHLGDRVSRGRMPLVDVLRIAEAVAGALSAAHDKGVIHRDLKPENVLLAPKGGVKVVDFGIAKLRGGQELTAFNSILGTITYMAPEQLMAGQIDGRADQFAFAAIVYEMLSGDMPFGSEGSIPEIAERVLRQQPEPITGYPPPLHEVLLKGMAKDAANRYPSVEEFFTAFRDVTRPILEAARAEAQAPMPAAPAVKVAPPKPQTPTPKPSPSPKPAPPPVVNASSLPTLQPGAVTIASPPAAPAAETTAEREMAEVDGELPELPGEQTSISMTPLPSERSGVGFEEMPTGETEPLPIASEQTRITVAPPAGAAPVARRVESVTGRIAALKSSLAGRLGRRGGIALGVIIGVVIAVAASLIWR
jgi:serine/threonine-protein kinase